MIFYCDFPASFSFLTQATLCLFFKMRFIENYMASVSMINFDEWDFRTCCSKEAISFF